MVKKAVSLMLYYRMHLLAALAVLLITGRILLMPHACEALSLDDESAEAVGHAAACADMAMWCYAAMATLRRRRYYRLTGRDYGKDRRRYSPLSYSDLVTAFEPALQQEVDVDSLPRMNWRESSGIVLGKVKGRLISYEPGKDGVVVFAWGAPGTGKSSSIIAPSCIRFAGSAVVLDVKGELYAISVKNGRSRRTKCFSLLSPSISARFDPLSLIRAADDDTREELLGVLSIIVVPDEASKDAAYFVKVARAFFMGIFLFVLHIDAGREFPSLCMDISLHGYQEWGSMIEQSGYEIASKYTNRFKDENPANVGGGFSKLVEALSLYTSMPLKELLCTGGEQISPEDLDAGDTDIFIQVDSTRVGYYSSIIGMLFEVLLKGTLERRTLQDRHSDGKTVFRPCCFVLDEFGQLPAMPSLLQMAALGRGYCCSLLISCQSLAMIDQHYGEPGRKALMDCAKGHAFLSIMDPDTREWASRLIGTRVVLKVGKSEQSDKHRGSGRSISMERERIIEPEDFGRLPEMDKAVIYYGGRYIIADKTYYFKQP